MNPIAIRLLTAADAPAYRALMLQAYVEAADAFTSTAEERQAEPLSFWEKRIADPKGLTLSFGAFRGVPGGRTGDPGATLAGTVALEFSAKPKTRHSALLLGMYVDPSARRLGAGRALVAAALAAAAARPGLRRVELTLTEGNAAALQLYEAAGFVAWGTQPEAIRTPAGFKGKVHMACPLTGA